MHATYRNLWAIGHHRERSHHHLRKLGIHRLRERAGTAEQA